MEKNDKPHRRRSQPPPPQNHTQNQTSQELQLSNSNDSTINSIQNSQQARHISLCHDSTFPKLKRRTSRFGLSSLFSRSKSLNNEKKLGTQWEADENGESSITADTGTQCEVRRSSFPQEPDVQPESESPALRLRHRASKAALRSKSSFKREPINNSPTNWNPPPLFQAYPQAVKHATLLVPALSAESILRHNGERYSSTSDKVESYTPNLIPMKPQKEKKLKKATTLDVLSKGEWTSKTFVLVTSGYFLQYSGQGNFDRLPEKIMPLSKESAAFASDAVPGKPYVLQVSQVSDEGTLNTDVSRSMFKKLGLRNEMGRSTSSILLVLENPEELSAWMASVRKEIQALGGKEYRINKYQTPAGEETVRPLQKPSQRYLVKRDPDRFAEKPQEPFPSSFNDSINMQDSPQQAFEMKLSAATQRQSLATQKSTDSRSVSNTDTSIDQIHLDELRESPRQSYASTAAKTTSTSRDSSPRPLPRRIYADVQESTFYSHESHDTASTYPRTAPSSVQKLPSEVRAGRTSLEHQLTTSSPSILKCTPQQRQNPSPAAPNFSVPTSTKRYSQTNSVTILSSIASKAQSPIIASSHQSFSPPMASQTVEIDERRTSILGDLPPLQKPSPLMSRGTDAHTSTPPQSSGSCDPPSFPETDRPFSRRSSSLEYSRGISPIQLVSPSPSPHPPPTIALPALPVGKPTTRATLIPPPTAGLPALRAPPIPGGDPTIPTATTPILAFPVPESVPRLPIAPSPPTSALPAPKFPRHDSSNIQLPRKALPIHPAEEPFPRIFVTPSPPKTPPDGSQSQRKSINPTKLRPQKSQPVVSVDKALQHSSIVQDSLQSHTKTALPGTRGLRRPTSMQVRSEYAVNNPIQPQTAFQNTFDAEHLHLRH